MAAMTTAVMMKTKVTLVYKECDPNDPTLEGPELCSCPNLQARAQLPPSVRSCRLSRCNLESLFIKEKVRGRAPPCTGSQPQTPHPQASTADWPPLPLPAPSESPEPSLSQSPNCAIPILKPYLPCQLLVFGFWCNSIPLD